MTYLVFRRDTDRQALLRSMLVALLALLGSSLQALDNPETTWSHKAWTAGFQEGRCAIWTGGDGSGTFEIAFDMGGLNGSADYLPIVYSNYPIPLRPDDAFEIIIDDRLSDFGSEMFFYDGPDSYDRYMVGAGLTGGFVPDLVAAFRQSNRLAIEVRHVGEAPFIADEFSLSGFTATYLKISDWCHFDPDKLFRS